jgi:hypothetical protein
MGGERMTPKDIADMLGMPVNSITVRRTYQGKMDKEDAFRIAEQCNYRHRNTNYESLLHFGIPRKEARKKINKRRKKR